MSGRIPGGKRHARRWVGLTTLAFVAACLPCVGHAADPPAAALDIQRLLHRQNARLDSLLNPESTRFDSTGINSLADSLDRGGFEAVRHHRPDAFQDARPGLSLRPGALSTYNRIEGVRAGFGVAPRYGRRVDMELQAAYGFEDHRWGGMARLGLGRRLTGPRLELGWSDLVVPFGPDALSPASAFLNLVAGQDRRDYLRRREFRATAWPLRRRQASARLDLFSRDDDPEVARTARSLIGLHTRPIEAANPGVDDVVARGIEAGGSLRLNGDLVRLSARAGVARVERGGLERDLDHAWQEAGAEFRPVLPDGGMLLLSLTGLNTGGHVPTQEVAYLGGDANLRGYNRLQFGGRQRVVLRAEYALGLDLLRRTGIPGVRSLHLQFIPFMDLGTTWGTARSVEGGGMPLDGALRSSTGLGIRHDLWLPGAEAVRLDIVHRNDGAGDPWSFWFRFVKIE